MSSIEKAFDKMGKKPGDKGDGGHRTATGATKRFAPGKAQSEYIEINTAKFQKLGLFQQGNQGNRTQLLEEYRHIKRAILKHVVPPYSTNDNVIMVTSSAPNEGKTFTAANLAVSISMEVENTVLLIDGDVVNPNVDRYLEIETGAGLLDYLKAENEPLSDFLYRTSIENLAYLPAGNRDARSAELLSSQRMKFLMEEISKRYQDRIIILDSPPLNAASEAGVLAGLAGQVIVVVAEQQTPSKVFKQTLNKLSSMNKKIGIILNKTIRKVNKNYYNYYGQR